MARHIHAQGTASWGRKSCVTYPGATQVGKGTHSLLSLSHTSSALPSACFRAASPGSPRTLLDRLFSCGSCPQAPRKTSCPKEHCDGGPGHAAWEVEPRPRTLLPTGFKFPFTGSTGKFLSTSQDVSQLSQAAHPSLLRSVLAANKGCTVQSAASAAPISITDTRVHPLHHHPPLCCRDSQPSRPQQSITLTKAALALPHSSGSRVPAPASTQPPRPDGQHRVSQFRREDGERRTCCDRVLVFLKALKEKRSSLISQLP